MRRKNMTFEQALHRLDEIAERLGDGGTTLEESLALYAEGAGLIERCSRELGEAKLKLETLGFQKDGETDGL
ncbi:MAG: exodeoxyribonuclease VII small subunit [Oscillospiraceae bacterium]|nr:exodeoxyribonuclease VII small subunit [Oscillospiraceae bacterium]